MVLKSFNSCLASLAIGLLAFSCKTTTPQTFDSVEGFYACDERSAYQGNRNYIVEVDKVASQENLYILANFHNMGDNEFLYAELILDTLYIKNQVIQTMFFNGKGKVWDDDYTMIELYYTTDDGVVELDYSALLSR